MRRIRCPKCGRVFELRVGPEATGRFYLPCSADHILVIWLDRGMVREVEVAESAPRGWELVEELVDAAPSWVDLGRVRMVVSGQVPPSPEDEAVLRLLREIGLLRPRV